MLTVCPVCEHQGNLDDFFFWDNDMQGHPTIESMECPKCPTATYYPYPVPRDGKGRFMKWNVVSYEDWNIYENPKFKKK